LINNWKLELLQEVLGFSHIEFQSHFWKGVPNTGKGKAVPLKAWTGPKVSRKLRFTDVVITAQDGGRLSALGTGRLYTQEMHLALISVRSWVDFRTMVRSEGFLVNENFLRAAELEPATTNYRDKLIYFRMPNRLHMEGWNEKDEFGEYILLHRPGGKNQLRIHWRRR